MRKAVFKRAGIAIALATMATPADATEIFFSGSMNGTAMGVPPPAGCTLRGSALTGTGNSTLGAFDYSHTVCLAGPGPITGNFLFDLSGGDTILGSIAGSAATTTTPGLFDLSLNYNILGGTGQFAGASGAFLGIGNVDQRTPGVTQVAINFSAVPEPGTWAMMLFGMGAVGAALRRRRPISKKPQLA